MDVETLIRGVRATGHSGDTRADRCIQAIYLKEPSLNYLSYIRGIECYLSEKTQCDFFVCGMEKKCFLLHFSFDGFTRKKALQCRRMLEQSDDLFDFVQDYRINRLSAYGLVVRNGL